MFPNCHGMVIILKDTRNFFFKDSRDNSLSIPAMYVVAEILQSQNENRYVGKRANINKLLNSIFDVTFIDCTQHQPL